MWEGSFSGSSFNNIQLKGIRNYNWANTVCVRGIVELEVFFGPKSHLKSLFFSSNSNNFKAKCKSKKRNLVIQPKRFNIVSLDQRKISIMVTATFNYHYLLFTQKCLVTLQYRPDWLRWLSFCQVLYSLCRMATVFLFTSLTGLSSWLLSLASQC